MGFFCIGWYVGFDWGGDLAGVLRYLHCCETILVRSGVMGI